MANLSWNEIQNRAIEFSTKYKGETYEKGESQSFWTDFLNVFGIDRKRAHIAFEYSVKKLDGNFGFVDMFWPGKIIAEQKSGGKSLEGANQQAREYLTSIPQEQLPQAIVVSDFERIHIDFLDVDSPKHIEFRLKDFPKKVKLFGFLIDRTAEISEEEDPVNRKAAELMARLHNQLRENNYTGTDLELLLVRLVFILFADDSGIWEKSLFENYLKDRTAEDGTDLGPKLIKIFELLNKPHEQRQSELDDDLKNFEYIDGGLFKQRIEIPDFNTTLRKELLNATLMDWSEVSPAIFGSMFQGVMDEKSRRNLGAHYTSEKNILKLIKPLFLDDLNAEFEEVKNSKRKLEEFHEKLSGLKFLDPACGGGNFLVITYRELRRLEHRVLDKIHKGQSLLNIFELKDNIRLDVDQFYGIEIEEFPALIAETALWLTDHQMNVEASDQFGQHFARLPLTKSGTIVQDNALTIDWRTIIPPSELNYILGNPPFIGKKEQSESQKKDFLTVMEDIKSASNLDFVSAWYVKAALYMKANKKIEAAFVSTNSITQGEQVSLLWYYLLKMGININFAHQTFKWSNDAKGTAAVHCVIIGFSFVKAGLKKLYTYTDLKANPELRIVSNINPYLVEGENTLVIKRSKPIQDWVPEILFGSMANDDGYLTFPSTQEKDKFINKEPNSEKYLRKFIGSEEFINSNVRWCLWLKDIDPGELKRMPFVLERVNNVRKSRSQSTRKATQILSDSPMLFGEDRQPDVKYLVIPRVSSENRRYIPIGYLPPSTVANDRLQIIPGASLYHFGVLTSLMHMAWTSRVCGRMKSDYNYSNTIVYNNFPWPENVKADQEDKVKDFAQVILDARSSFANNSLADLYGPSTMPPILIKAHQNLDKYVESLYRKEPFFDDTERVAFLLDRYKKLSQE